MKKLIFTLIISLFLLQAVHAEFIGVMGKDNPETKLTIIDDFIGGSTETGEVGESNWIVVAGALTTTSGLLNHPGIKNLDTGASINTITALALGASSAAPQFDADENFDSTYIIRTSSDLTSQEIRIGALAGNWTTNPAVTGVWFLYDSAGTSADVDGLADSTHWLCVSAIGSVYTATAVTSQTVAVSTWYKFRIRRLSATEIQFFINDVSVCTHSTDNPTTSIQSGFQIENLVAATRNIDIDYFKLSISGMSR